MENIEIIGNREKLYVGCGYDIVALDAYTGEEKRRYPDSDRFRGSFDGSSPTIKDGAVYAGVDGGMFYSIDKDSVNWKIQLSDSIDSSASIVDNTLYVGSDSGLHAVNITDKKEDWKLDIGTIYSSPAISKDMIFITNNDGELYGIGKK